MLVVDILNKKRIGKELSYKELDFIFNDSARCNILSCL